MEHDQLSITTMHAKKLLLDQLLEILSATKLLKHQQESQSNCLDKATSENHLMKMTFLIRWKKIKKSPKTLLNRVRDKELDLLKINRCGVIISETFLVFTDGYTQPNNSSPRASTCSVA